jgi:hypothetical protein
MTESLFGINFRDRDTFSKVSDSFTNILNHLLKYMSRLKIFSLKIQQIPMKIIKNRKINFKILLII